MNRTKRKGEWKFRCTDLTKTLFSSVKPCSFRYTIVVHDIHVTRDTQFSRMGKPIEWCYPFVLDNGEKKRFEQRDNANSDVVVNGPAAAGDEQCTRDRTGETVKVVEYNDLFSETPCLFAETTVNHEDEVVSETPVLF